MSENDKTANQDGERANTTDDGTTDDREGRERTGRPVQATPAFFVETVAEHEDRGDIEGGACYLRMADGGRRRFVLGTDVNEMEEGEYLINSIDDLIDLLDSTDLGPDEFEVRVPVDDADRVVEEIETDGVVTVAFDEEGLSDLLATCLADIVAGDGDQ